MISNEVKQVFMEQLDFSSSEIERLKNETTKESFEQLKKHAALIEDIKTRVDIYFNSQANENKIRKDLINL